MNEGLLKNSLIRKKKLINKRTPLKQKIHLIATKMKKNDFKLSKPTDISQLISSLFESAGETIDPLIIQNEAFAGKEMSAVIKSVESSKDWDDQLAIVQKLIALVKGNACNFQSFNCQLPNLVSFFGSCILNQRSTLVKYVCLLISQLVKQLKDRFEGVGDAILPVLFQPTSNGTQIISNSCKYAIYSIIHNCKSKKMMLTIIDQTSSNSNASKVIASECLTIMLNEWTKNIFLPYFKQLEKSMYNLLSDSNYEVRNNARESASLFLKIFPNRNSSLYPLLNNKTISNSSFVNDSNNNSEKNDLNYKHHQDLANTISFSYQPITSSQDQQKSTNSNASLVNEPNSQKKDESKDNSIKKQNSSNIPVSKKRGSFSIIDSNIKSSGTKMSKANKTSNSARNFHFDEQIDQTVTFSFDPKNSESIMLSAIPKQKNMIKESKTISFLYDPTAQAKASSFSKAKNRSSNLSVHFTKKEDILIEENNGQISEEENYDDHFQEEEDSKSTEDKINDVKQELTIDLSSSNYFTTSLGKININHFECNDGREYEFLDSIRTSVATKQTVFIEENGEATSNGFLKCIQSPVEPIQISALNLIGDVIKIIPEDFENKLEVFIKIILEKADKSKSPKTATNASTALRAFSSQFPADKLLLIAIKCPISESLLSFAANLVRKDENILCNDLIAASLLPICCTIYETTNEQRFSALSVGLLNKINEVNQTVFIAFAESVDENWVRLLKSLYLDTSNKINYQYNSTVNQEKPKPGRVLNAYAQFKSSNQPETKLDDLLRELSVSKDKNDAFKNLIDFFKETKGEYFEPAIPYLVSLIHSSYNYNVNNCIKVIAKETQNQALSESSISTINYSSSPSVLLDATVDFTKNDMSQKAIDFLANVIQYYKISDISPRLQEILSIVKPLLDDEKAIIRKSAIMVIVELRMSIGKVLDGEINKLPNISKQLVNYYVKKREIEQI